MLIREVALESGCGAAGIGERIYARDGERPMAGILLYTAAPDSEGSHSSLTERAPVAFPVAAERSSQGIRCPSMTRWSYG
jgi:hypothetical protein